MIKLSIHSLRLPIPLIFLLSIFSVSVLATPTYRNLDSNETDTYKALYESSVLRNFKYESANNPEVSVKEDICLESHLARMAQENGLTTDPTILKLIQVREDLEIFKDWLRSEIPEPTQSEIGLYYDSHKDQFAIPEMVVFRHLFLLVSPDNSEEDKRKYELAARIAKDAQRTGDLIPYILRHSEIESAPKDKGRLGPVHFARLNAPLKSAISKLKPDEISEPVRTPYGWEIVQLESKTSASYFSLDEAQTSITKTIFVQKAEDLRNSAGELLSKEFPVNVYDERLAMHDIPATSVLFTVADKSYTLGDTSQTVLVMNLHAEELNHLKRIAASLPQLTLIEQIKHSAEKKGLTRTSAFLLKKQFIANRTWAEHYINNLITKREPSPQEIQEVYKANNNIFRSPPQAMGTLYSWNLPQDRETSSNSESIFKQTLLTNTITSMTREIQNGTMSMEQLASKADDVKHLDWFQEGPMGYHHDVAWFKTPKQSFTKPYINKQTIYLGYVKDIREPEQLPLSKVTQQLRIRLKNEWSKEERNKLITEILKQCVPANP